jgi:two-component system NarL family sensor kinase
MRSINTSYIIYILLFCSLIVQKCLSQDQIIVDSLFKELKIVKTVAQRIDVYNELAWQYRKLKKDIGEQYARIALKLSDSINDISKRSTSLSRLGTIKIYQQDYDYAEKIYKKLLILDKKSGNLYGIGRANNQLGRIYKEQGKFIKSIEYRLKSLEIFERIKDSIQIAIVYNNLGDAYKELLEFDLAMKSLTNSLTIERQLKNHHGSMVTLANIGSLHIEMQNYEKAIEVLNESKNYFIKQKDDYWLLNTYIDLGIAHMRLYNFDLSLNYTEKAKEMNKEMGLENDGIIYNNLGTLYSLKGDLSKAMSYYEKSISTQSSDNKYNYLDARINIADILYKRKKYNEAIDYLEEALRLTDTYEKAIVKLKIYNDLSVCYAAMQNDKKALEYRNEYLKLDKNLRSSHIKAIQFEAAYNEQQNEMELLRKSKELTKTQLEKLETENTLKQTQVSALLIVLVIMSLLFFFINRALKLKAKTNLAEKNRELDKKNVQELLDKQEIRFNQARIDGQDKERKRIAKDLHDGLGSLLSMVKVYYKSIEDEIETNNISSKKQYQKANELLDKACDEVRKISQEIHSGILAKFGLIAALEDLVATVNDSKQLRVEFNTHSIDDRLNNVIETNVFRIIQELMNNILKHASASEVNIQLLQNDAILNVVIEDNGRGFKYDSRNSEGMGLRNIKSRVDKLSGDIYFDSILGNGTTITLNLPLKDI